MNKHTMKIERDADLDSLFAQARVEQPVLSDANFSKVIVNRLPSKVSRLEKRSFSFDVVGMILGLVAVFFFIEPTQIFSAVLSVVPESMTLSVSTLALGLLGCIGFSFGAWWVVEQTT